MMHTDTLTPQLLRGAAKNLRTQAQRLEELQAEQRQAADQERQETRLRQLTEIRAKELAANAIAELVAKITELKAKLATMATRQRELKRSQAATRKAQSETAKLTALVAEQAAEIQRLRDELAATQPTEPKRKRNRPDAEKQVVLLRAEYRNLQTQYQGATHEASCFKFKALRCGKRLEAAQQKLRAAQKQIDELCADNQVLRSANELLSARVGQ